MIPDMDFITSTFELPLRGFFLRDYLDRGPLLLTPVSCLLLPTREELLRQVEELVDEIDRDAESREYERLMRDYGGES